MAKRIGTNCVKDDMFEKEVATGINKRDQRISERRILMMILKSSS